MRAEAILRGILPALCVALLAACSESPQVVEYKKGQYQGKRDTRPWESAEFKGDKQAWENTLRNRNQAQNEYKRSE